MFRYGYGRSLRPCIGLLVPVLPRPFESHRLVETRLTGQRRHLLRRENYLLVRLGGEGEVRDDIGEDSEREGKEIEECEGWPNDFCGEWFRPCKYENGERRTRDKEWCCCPSHVT